MFLHFQIDYWANAVRRQAFGLPITEVYAETLAAQDAKARQHTSRHRCSAEEFGIDVERMSGELATFYREYGWDEPVPAGASAQ